MDPTDLLAFAMQQTREVFRAWFVGFWQDVLFSFRAVGSITPGARAW